MTQANVQGHSWATADQDRLESAIRVFKTMLPGWWYSLGECEKSCDASCAPTSETPDITRIMRDDRFNSGFHADLPQPSTLADALLDVAAQAVAAIIEDDRKLEREA